jgi:hypothetical protein
MVENYFIDHEDIQTKKRIFLCGSRREIFMGSRKIQNKKAVLNKQKQAETWKGHVSPHSFIQITYPELPHERISIRYFVLQLNNEFTAVKNFNRSIWQKKSPRARQTGQRTFVARWQLSGAWQRVLLLSLPRLTTPADELQTKATKPEAPRKENKNQVGESRRGVCVCARASRVCACVLYNIDFTAHPFVWPGFELRGRALLHNLHYSTAYS